MKPEEFSALALYGQREVFERKQSEGYTEVAFGNGGWVGAEKIVACWVFYHPKKWFRSVSTIQYPKFDDGCHTVRGDPFERNYSQKGFEKYARRMDIKMGERQSLANLLSRWVEEELE